MAIDPHYIPAFSIEDVILDKDTGAPLSGGLVYFEQDNNRGVLKPVYQITGSSPNYQYIQLPNPMTLSSIGTFVDSLDNPVIPYFFPFDGAGNPEYYYVRVTSSGAVPQFAREAVPYIPEELNPASSTVNYTNELSNPQFAEVLFDAESASYVYNFTGATLLETPLAPNWDLVVSGTGTVTVSQVTPTGSVNRPTNPGTLLNINSSGITLLRLRQRLYGSPNLFGSSSAANPSNVSGFLMGKTFAGTSTVLRMLYSQSAGGVTDQVILSATLNGDGSYGTFSGAALLPVSTNPQTFPDAYVDIDIEIPVGVNIELSSIQLVSTGSTIVSNVPYDQETNNRQIDFLFHYYKPQLEFKPIPSLLVGWDFPLNPAQFPPTAPAPSPGNIITTSRYIWDQTICQSVVGNCAFARNAVTGGLQVTTANNNEAFYVMQYLEDADAKEILGNRLSVNINAFRTQTGGAVTCQVFLYRGSSSASFPTLPATIGGNTPLAANGTFTKNNTAGQGQNWTLINRGNLGQASGSLSVVDTGTYSQLNDVIDLKFNGWEITDSTEISNTDKFCIVVSFACPTTGTVVVIDSISLVKGDIPTRPAAESPASVLLKCQYYDETSYNPGVVPGTINAGGALFAEMLGNHTGGGDNRVIPRSFGWHFLVAKRTDAPVIQFYSPISGGAAAVRMFLRNNGVAVTDQDVSTTNWTQNLLSSTGVTYLANNITAVNTVAGADSFAEGYINYHYRVNARLGEVA